VKNVLVPKKDTQEKATAGNFLVVQWLGPYSLTAEGQTSIPCWGTKSLQATWHSQKKKNQNKNTPILTWMLPCLVVTLELCQPSANHKMKSEC